MRFCIKCGNQIIEQAARFCDKCGSPLKDVQDQDQNPHANMKEMEISMSSTEMRIRKIIAVLIAVFLGRCTWLYTLRKDAWKASLGLGITLSLLVTWVVIYITRTRFLATMPPGVIYEGYEIIGLFIFSFPCFFGTWLWAVIDAASKGNNWFSCRTVNRNKKTAVLLAIFVGPWTWLYTYKYDAWKFWLGILIGYGFILSSAIMGNGYLIPIWFIGSLVVWIVSIINTANRNEELYKKISERI